MNIYEILRNLKLHCSKKGSLFLLPSLQLMVYFSLTVANRGNQNTYLILTTTFGSAGSSSLALCTLRCKLSVCALESQLCFEVFSQGTKLMDFLSPGSSLASSHDCSEDKY